MSGGHERRPRVVVLAPLPPPVTGQSRATASAVDALAARASVTVVDTSDPHLLWRRPGRVPLGHAVAWGRTLVRLRRAMAVRPDVVYLTPAASPLGLARDLASLALIPRRVPVVAHVYAGDYARLFDRPGIRRAARIVARRVARWIAPSEYAARPLRQAEGVNEVRVLPIRIPAPLRVSAAEREARWTRSRDEPHVAFVSNMIPSKGYAVLAEAVEAWEASTGRTLRVTYAGAWPDEADRRAFQARLAKGAGRWHVAGPLDAPAVRALLLDADAFAFPSRYPHESFGLAVLEAMHAGCGIVALRHAAIEELVRDGVEGRIAADAAAFADALADVLADPQRYGRAASARARGTFDPDATDAALVEAVLGAVDGPVS